MIPYYSISMKLFSLRTIMYNKDTLLASLVCLPQIHCAKWIKLPQYVSKMPLEECRNFCSAQFALSPNIILWCNLLLNLYIFSFFKFKNSSFQSAGTFCFVKVSRPLLGNDDIRPLAEPFLSTLLASSTHLQAGLPFPCFHVPHAGLSSLTPSLSSLMPPRAPTLTRTACLSRLKVIYHSSKCSQIIYCGII